ncbi:MAG: hypothetical protein H0W75_03430, partial [Chitinophagaceae bacterium]|nr:hypothetical protein [Chitinophagaceae bacterium]
CILITILLIFNSCKKQDVENIVPAIPPVLVTDADLHGWVKAPKGLATVEFVKGPVTPVLGSGSVRFSSPDKSFARLINMGYSGTPLSSITELSYSGFVEKRDSTVDTNALILEIDNNGDGLSDIHLIYEPRYQTGKFVAGTSIPDPGNSKTNTWQTWDGLKGGWFGIVKLPGDPDPDQGAVLYTLAEYINKNPNATIVNNKVGGITPGGIRVQVGGPVFSKNFIGYVDNIKIGVNGITTTYDFE